MLLMLLIPVTVTAALALGVWWWTPLYHRRPTIRLLATLIATSAAIVWSQLSLGMLRVLTPAALGAVALVLIVPLHAGYWFWGRGFLAERADRIAKPSKIGTALAIVVGAVYAWISWVASLIPPWAWDTLTYHLTNIFQLARSRSLDVFPNVPGGAAHFFFPQVAELHASWFYLLSGAGESSYRVAGFGLMWLTLTAGVGARAAVEALGLRTALPWIVPTVMLTPALASQPIELYVDSTFAAFLLAAFAFGIWADRESRFAHLVFCAIASGLAFGVKVSFLYFFLPIAVVLLSLRVWHALTRQGTRIALARFALLFVLFISGFGFWLGRNLVNHGNPFWPTRVEIGGVTLFDGPSTIPQGSEGKRYVSSSAEWLVYWFRETYHGAPSYAGSNGFGPLFAAGYASLFLVLPLAFARKEWRLVRALVALPLTVVLFLTVHPTSMPRYVFAMIGFATIALAVVLEMIAYGWKGATAQEKPHAVPNRRPLRIATAALSIAIVFSALGCTVSVADELGRVIPRWRGGTWKPDDYYRLKYGAAGTAFNWIAEHGGPDVTVTATNATFIAPVLGWHNRNRVVHAALPGDPEPVGGARVRGYAEWRKFLHDQKVNYIIVWVPWWGETTDRANEIWIEEHGDDFALVEDFGRAKIYRPIFRGGVLTQTLPKLKRLGEVDSWKLEYRKGAEASARAGDEGVRFDYAFTTPGNDYFDWRARIACDDWSAASTLSFDINAENQPSYLIIYLKNNDPSQSCRFRVDLRNLSSTRGRIRIPIRSPEWRSEQFDLKNICEVHVVLDDVDDATAPRGSVQLANFTLDSSNRSTGSEP